MSSSPHLTCEAIQIYHPLLAPHDFHSLFQQQLNLTVFSLNYPSFPPYIWKNCVFASDDPRVKDMFLQKFPFHSTQNAEIMSLDKQSCIYFLWAHIDLMFWNGSSPTDSEFLCAKLILKSSTHTQCVSGQHPSTYPQLRTAFRLHQTPGSQLFNCTERITNSSRGSSWRRQKKQKQLLDPTKRWAIRSFATYPASFSVHQATQSLQWLAVWKWANLGDHTCPGPTDSNRKQPFFSTKAAIHISASFKATKKEVKFQFIVLLPSSQDG